MAFESRISAANGEDSLYVFYNNETGDHILLSYNMIRQNVETPVICSGFSYFESGEMLIFRNDPEPVKHHVVQIWQTPFLTGEHAFSEKSDSFLYKIGNKDIVRCMAECNTLQLLLQKEDVYSGLYMDIVRVATDIIDTFFWLDREDAFHLKETLSAIKDAANNAVDEFEKVVRLQKNTASRVKEATERAQAIIDKIRSDTMDRIDHFVTNLADLRSVRGEIVSLRELRYVDIPSVDTWETQVSRETDRLSGLCVEFLLKPEALHPYEEKITGIEKRIEKLDRVAEAKKVEEEIGDASDELEMLIEIVSNLKIEDTTQTTRIIDNISAIYSTLNQVKASLRNTKKSLQSVEGVAQFNAQLKLLNQSVINYLDICDIPEKCDEYLTKVMIQVEELEGRFADFDEFVVQLSEKRDEVYNAFESRKLNLVEARNRKADALMRAAERILKGIRNRVDGMEEINAINGYFASDLMIEKIRDIVGQLNELNDSVKADDIQSRLKTIREDAVRQLKDRKELFVGGENVIRFGEHNFSVNVQPLDLTVVRREDRQFFHLSGTDFFEAIEDQAFLETQSVWDMTVPSEDKAVYRGEFLAWQLLKDLVAADGQERDRIKALSPEERLEHVQKFMGPRYSEGYTKGVHDRDAEKIFGILAEIHENIGLLRYHPRVRALARLFWQIGIPDGREKERILARIQGFGMMSRLFPGNEKQARYILELEKYLTDFIDETGLFPPTDAENAATYLFFELAAGERFVISKEGRDLTDAFKKGIKPGRHSEKFKESRSRLTEVPAQEYELIRDWVTGFIAHQESSESEDYIDEITFLFYLSEEIPLQHVIEFPLNADIEKMVGDHAVIREGKYHLNYIRFADNLTRFENEILPLFHRFHDMKKQLTDQMRNQMRLEEFKPRILTSFVRNKLINRVYLPLIGDNLAKQMGVVGEQKRTDLMGMLLLISPPGYGKTTLMEYIANRLGIIFMKINGPAIGHEVTSLDPSEAPNAAAREEMNKLNLSLEMGDNVMLYLDDIQHCNPEFLQKFISLCDAQRKIEGIYKGRSKTYDLRGKKVVVVMAGNPYTESGDKFQIPDMLANRADTYNLGDIIGDTVDDFETSYLENALTSNPILNKLSSRSQDDVYSVIQISKTRSREGVEFSAPYSGEEINEMVSVMEKMITLQDIVLKVNKEYIRSASQSDDYRTEPPFKLQGSYRNMNRLTEKIVPIMNEQELKTLILSHYENESQTLTTGAESNMLKFLEMTGWMSEEDKARWDDIKRGFKRNLLLRGADESDPVSRVISQLSTFQEGLDSIRSAMAEGVSRLVATREEEAAASQSRTEQWLQEMKKPREETTEKAPEKPEGPIQAMVAFTEETIENLKKTLGEIKTIPVMAPGTVVQSAVPLAGAPVGNYSQPAPPKTAITKASAAPTPASEAESIKRAPIAPTTLRSVHKMARSEFYKAIKKGDVKALAKLLNEGKDPNIRSSEGATPLMAATVNRQPAIARLLLESGAQIDAQDGGGYSALMIAASKGRVEVLKVLLANGANVNLIDKDGMTALMWAKKNGHTGIVRLLQGKPN